MAEGKKKVVVIGTGIGGAGCAALLAKEGYEVTVLEKNKFIGGRTATGHKKGFAFDMGVHLSGSGAMGPCGEINNRIGGGLQWITKDPLIKLIRGNRSHTLGQDLRNLGELYGLAKAIGVKPKNIPAMIRAFGGLLFAQREEDVEPYDDIPLIEYLYQYTDDEEFFRMIEVYCGLMLCVTIDEASAGEFIWCFSNFTWNHSCAYPRGGFEQIPFSYLEVLKSIGGTVHTNAPVQKIVVENGEVKGVEADRFYPADIVVSNAGIKKTVELTGTEEFPSSYVDKVSSLKSSLSGLTIKYGLDRKMMDIPMTLQYDTDINVREFFRKGDEGHLDTCPFIFLPAPSFMDPELAPPGKDLIIAGALAPKDPKDKKFQQKFLDLLHEKVKVLVPNLEDHIVFKQDTTVNTITTLSGHDEADVVGIAQTYDQVGKNKPRPDMPVHGLYLAGCDAGGRGIGTEQAADSALKVVELIIRQQARARKPVGKAIKVPQVAI